MIGLRSCYICTSRKGSLQGKQTWLVTMRCFSGVKYINIDGRKEGQACGRVDGRMHTQTRTHAHTRIHARMQTRTNGCTESVV